MHWTAEEKTHEHALIGPLDFSLVPLVTVKVKLIDLSSGEEEKAMPIRSFCLLWCSTFFVCARFDQGQACEEQGTSSTKLERVKSLVASLIFTYQSATVAQQV